jgi:cytosine/adenosine deaminase-related metal-dependent hydrolase
LNPETPVWEYAVRDRPGLPRHAAHPRASPGSRHINAAAAIRREEALGSIHPGKQADLLVLAVDDYRHLAYRFGAACTGNLKKGKLHTKTQLC